MKNKPKIRLVQYVDNNGVHSVFYQLWMDFEYWSRPFKDIDGFFRDNGLQNKNFV